MTPQAKTLTLANAKAMTLKAGSEASRLGIGYASAVVDAGGHLVHFSRDESCVAGCAQLAIDKAYTAAMYGSQARPRRQLRRAEGAARRRSVTQPTSANEEVVERLEPKNELVVLGQCGGAVDVPGNQRGRRSSFVQAMQQF